MTYLGYVEIDWRSIGVQCNFDLAIFFKNMYEHVELAPERVLVYA